MNYYQHHLGDYAAATGHLSLLEHGVYFRLLSIYYIREGPLPESQVMRLIGARTPDEQGAVRDVLNEFFTLDGDVYRHKRCDSEIEKYSDKSRKASESAKARWSHSGHDADAMRTHSEGNANQEPITNNQEPRTKKETKTSVAPSALVSVSDLIDLGCSEQEARDWLTVRKTKRQPLTASALKRYESKARSAGMSLAQAVSVSAANGWSGFDAEWLVSSVGRGRTGQAAESPWVSEKRKLSEALRGVSTNKEFIDVESKLLG